MLVSSMLLVVMRVAHLWISKIGLVTALYFGSNVLLYLTQLVEESTLRMGIVLDD